jgi:predicted acetyltransferase
MTNDGEAASPLVEITAVAPDQESVLANLLELYAYDFSEFHNLNLDENGRFGYAPLPLYWSEANRHPFFIRIDGKLAGLVLVKKGSEISGNCEAWDMAEFFIVRGYRRQGAGSQAAYQTWRRFPGLWEVRVMQKNTLALQFWAKAISAFVGETMRPRRIEKDGNFWELFSFRSDSLSASATLEEDIDS